LLIFYYDDLHHPSNSDGVDAGENDLIPTDDLDLDEDDDIGKKTPLDLNCGMRFMEVVIGARYWSRFSADR